MGEGTAAMLRVVFVDKGGEVVLGVLEDQEYPGPARFESWCCVLCRSDDGLTMVNRLFIPGRH